MANEHLDPISFSLYASRYPRLRPERIEEIEAHLPYCECCSREMDEMETIARRSSQSRGGMKISHRFPKYVGAIMLHVLQELPKLKKTKRRIYFFAPEIIREARTFATTLERNPFLNRLVSYREVPVILNPSVETGDIEVARSYWPFTQDRRITAYRALRKSSR